MKCDFCQKSGGTITTRLTGLFFHRECEMAHPFDLAFGWGLSEEKREALRAEAVAALPEEAKPKAETTE